MATPLEHKLIQAPRADAKDQLATPTGIRPGQAPQAHANGLEGNQSKGSGHDSQTAHLKKPHASRIRNPEGGTIRGQQG
eukprot:10279089-Karenia_brevis.AAC.1